MRISPIIEIDELLKIYKNSDVIIFDASNNINAKNNYENEHLENAYFIDLNLHLADIKENLAEGGRHPLPQIDNFAKTLNEFGISKGTHIVIYDDKFGSNAAARFWWMLKSIGHEKVQVLNGGFNQAKKHNFPLKSGIENPKPNKDDYNFLNWILPTISMNEVELITYNPAYTIIDVREEKRYNGESEPIDLIAGHIPNAINIPFTENIDQNGFFLHPTLLKNKYKETFDKAKAENIIVHCGSGVTACHTLLALDYAEFEIPNLYVGSWSEWSRNNKKIEKKNT